MEAQPERLDSLAKELPVWRTAGVILTQQLDPAIQHTGILKLKAGAQRKIGDPLILLVTGVVVRLNVRIGYRAKSVPPGEGLSRQSRSWCWWYRAPEAESCAKLERTLLTSRLA